MEIKINFWQACQVCYANTNGFQRRRLIKSAATLLLLLGLAIQLVDPSRVRASPSAQTTNPTPVNVDVSDDGVGLNAQPGAPNGPNNGGGSGSQGGSNNGGNAGTSGGSGDQTPTFTVVILGGSD